jgi:hypothetical protein
MTSFILWKTFQHIIVGAGGIAEAVGFLWNGATLSYPFIGDRDHLAKSG